MAPDDLDPPEDDAPPREPDGDEPEDHQPSDDDGPDHEPADDGAPAGSRSELRAKDLVTRSREELEEELDPATMAELASWFTRPSMTEVRAREVPEEVTAGGGAPRAELDAFEKLGAALGYQELDDAVRNRALAAIEPRMLDLLDRHTRAADAILPVRPEPKAVIDETILPASVRALVPVEGEELPLFGEPRVLERTRDIDDLLNNDNAPQAVLRDLNRPVEEFERRLERLFAAPTPGEDMTTSIRETLRWRPEAIPPRVPIPDVRDDWRPFHAGSWVELVTEAKALRAAETKAAAEQEQRDLEAGILWRF